MTEIIRPFSIFQTTRRLDAMMKHPEIKHPVVINLSFCGKEIMTSVKADQHKASAKDIILKDRNGQSSGRINWMHSSNKRTSIHETLHMARVCPRRAWSTAAEIARTRASPERNPRICPTLTWPGTSAGKARNSLMRGSVCHPRPQPKHERTAALFPSVNPADDSDAVRSRCPAVFSMAARKT